MMTRRFFIEEKSSNGTVGMLVLLNDRFYWKARLGNKKSNRLLFEGHESGQITDVAALCADFEEVTEKDFWKSTGRHESMIRWALSAYSIHLSRQMLIYLSQNHTSATEQQNEL